MVTKISNKNNVGIKMDNHCPICHAVLPNGNTFCKNCGIDINEAEKKRQEQYADDKKATMEKIEAEAKAKRDAINATLNVRNNKQEFVQETKKKTNPFLDKINKMRGKN